MARLSPTIQGPCGSCVCRVIPVPCLGSGFLRCHCRRALSCSIAACSGFFLAMAQTLPWLLISVSLGQLSRIPLCPLAVLHPMLFFAALGALSSSPAPMPWSAPLLHCRKKKKRAKKEDRRKQRQQERTEKGKKTDLGRVEPPSSASQPEWLKKAMPHP